MRRSSSASRGCARGRSMGLFRPNVEKLKAKRDVGGLSEALGYDKTRADAFLALGDLGGGQAIGALGRALNDLLPTCRHRATVALAGLVDDRRAPDFLITAGTDSDVEVHRAAQEALAQVGLRRAVSDVGWLRKYRTPRLIDFGLVDVKDSGGRIWEFQLTSDGLLYADAMLGERDCPEHPDILD